MRKLYTNYEPLHIGLEERLTGLAPGILLGVTVGLYKATQSEGSENVALRSRVVSLKICSSGLST